MGVTPAVLADATAEQAFIDADANRDGVLTRQEFREWYLTSNAAGGGPGDGDDDDDDDYNDDAEYEYVEDSRATAAAAAAAAQPAMGRSAVDAAAAARLPTWSSLQEVRRLTNLQVRPLLATVLTSAFSFFYSLATHSLTHSRTHSLTHSLLYLCCAYDRRLTNPR